MQQQQQSTTHAHISIYYITHWIVNRMFVICTFVCFKYVCWGFGEGEITIEKGKKLKKAKMYEFMNVGYSMFVSTLY